MTQRPLHAVAMVLIVLAGAACGTGAPSATPSSPPSPAPTALPSPTLAPTSAPTSADGWRLVPDQASVREVKYDHVVWTGARFVATGVALDGAGTMFLDSSDGLTWQRQPTATPNAYPVSLAAGPGGVVAVGTIDDRPATWFSPDGLAWTVRADAFPVSAVGTDTFQVTAVVATDAGWLAVGREDPFCQTNCGLAPVRAMVWTSSDGLDWARVPDQASLSGAAMTAVARLDSGFVAVGLAGVYAAVWTSTDGTSWSRVPDSPLFHELPSADPSLWTTMTGVAAGHGVVVAVGNEGNGGAHGPAARAWWSTDGLTWAPADGDHFLSGGEIDVRLTSVTVTPDGFLAAGFSTGGCLGGLWVSTDGRAWRCVALDPAFAGFRPSAAAASSSVEVAVGLEASTNPPPAGFPGAVWRRTLP
jgi:hypothetical protein